MNAVAMLNRSRSKFVGLPQNSRSSSFPVLALVLVLSAFALGATVTGAVLYVRHVFQTTVVNVAKASGIRLALGRVRWGLDFIQVFDSRFELYRIPGVSGTVRRIDVDLAGLTPSRILLQKVTVSAKGDPVSLYRELSAFSRQLELLQLSRASNTKSPKLELAELDFNLESTHPLLPNLAVTNLTVTRGLGAAKDETSIATTTTRVGATNLGPLSLAFREPLTGGVELGFGKTLAESQWVVGYRETPSGPSVALALQPTDATVLFARLGQPVPVTLAKAKVEGRLTFALDATSGKGVGKLDLALDGFVPPYPAELRGYAVSQRTLVGATLESDPLLTTFSIPVLSLDNGDIHFLGNGKIERLALVARIVADLSTTLDCVTLAKGFARSDVGGQLGAWGESRAARAIQGQVSVRLQLDTVTNDLANAKLVKRVGVGCGLRPMTLEDLLSLGLPPPPAPAAAERLTRQLISRVTLPSFPSLLPSFNKVFDDGLGATKRGKDVNAAGKN